jgi:hypothetical protein
MASIPITGKYTSVNTREVAKVLSITLGETTPGRKIKIKLQTAAARVVAGP